jgi:hypothetical protein
VKADDGEELDDDVIRTSVMGRFEKSGRLSLT